MTFCLGITVDQGLVGIADTRVVAGNECLVARKTATYQGPGFAFFVMHSGLRSAARQDPALLRGGLRPRNHDPRPPLQGGQPLRPAGAPRQRGGWRSAAQRRTQIQRLLPDRRPDVRRFHPPTLSWSTPRATGWRSAPTRPTRSSAPRASASPFWSARSIRSDSMLYAFKVGMLAFDATRLCAADVDFPDGRAALLPRQLRNGRAALPARRPARHLRLVAGAHARAPCMTCPRNGSRPPSRHAYRRSPFHASTATMSPVYLEPHTFRLRPREDALAAPGAVDARHHAHTVRTGPSASIRMATSSVRAWFDSAHAGTVPAHASSTWKPCATIRSTILLTALDAKLPMEYAPLLRAPLAPYLRYEQSAAVREFAESLAAECGWQTMPFLSALNQRLFASHAAGDPRRWAHLTPAETTLRDQEGSCRDLAVLFCAACRAVGTRRPLRQRLRARRLAAGKRRPARLGRSLPGRRRLARLRPVARRWPSAASHVAVAAASDPLLAAPVTGTYRGAASAKMEFSISMQVA